LMQQFPVSFVKLSKLDGDVVTGALYCVTAAVGFHPQVLVRQFTFKRGEWVSLVVRLTIHATRGECLLSVNGDAFQGRRGRVIKSDRSQYGGHWGLYGSATKDVNGKPLGDNTVWHRGIWIRKVSNSILDSR